MMYHDMIIDLMEKERELSLEADDAAQKKAAAIRMEIDEYMWHENCHRKTLETYTAKDILDKAERYGNRIALASLLVYGADSFDGTSVEYDELKKILESGC